MRNFIKKMNNVFVWIILLPVSYIAWSTVKTAKGVKKLNKKTEREEI